MICPGWQKQLVNKRRLFGLQIPCSFAHLLAAFPWAFCSIRLSVGSQKHHPLESGWVLGIKYVSTLHQALCSFWECKSQWERIPDRAPGPAGETDRWTNNTLSAMSAVIVACMRVGGWEMGGRLCIFEEGEMHSSCPGRGWRSYWSSPQYYPNKGISLHTT